MIDFLILINCMTLDSFVIMMEKGATCLNINIKNGVIHSLIFAVINSLAFLIGNGLGLILNLDSLKFINVCITCVIFIIISFILFARTVSKKEFIEKLDRSFSYKTSRRNALVSSIDTFLAGITTTILNISILHACLITFGITFIQILIALYVGYYRGAAHQKKIRYCCSIVYLILAFYELSKLLPLV